ncbi:MAG: hypothetical protein OEV49_14075 [candidate division Zixibacteria bacterium]|nr:hypothetical protein [candidate division Zixibacteria bacterium]MDH3938815.1 hypothetical protein [candidate division Zixibacteria bacterium]MDH4035758.1 hypothetical protein [candidate division Zixibacteria bacterium]
MPNPLTKREIVVICAVGAVGILLTLLSHFLNWPVALQLLFPAAMLPGVHWIMRRLGLTGQSPAKSQPDGIDLPTEAVKKRRALGALLTGLQVLGMVAIFAICSTVFQCNGITVAGSCVVVVAALQVLKIYVKQGRL